MDPRYTSLLRAFRETYPDARPPMFVRAPGRVNLIGEHTDYNGLPVLPIAIDRDVAVACAPRLDGLYAARNLDPRHGPRAFAIHDCATPFGQGDWGNYLKAAVRGLIEEGLLTADARQGVTAVFTGNVPEAAGLSSSSALVVAAALALLHCADIDCDPLRLAEVLARSERYAGLEGGGMDQAICLLACEGHALKIDFFPLRTRPVPLPVGFSFVVCNSLVRASKTAEARETYNTRVAECRLAALLLAHESGHIRLDHSRPLLAELLQDETAGSVETLLSRADPVLGKGKWTLPRIAATTGQTVDRVIAECCTARDGSVVAEPRGGFQLLPRLRHVLTENLRVESASRAARDGNMVHFGTLMDASHASCAADYEVSIPELDALVGLARKNGALGARLTGAGFGGCTVNLVPDEAVGAFCAAMEHEWYETYIPAHDRGQFTAIHTIRDALFPCHAGPPAQRIQF